MKEKHILASDSLAEVSHLVLAYYHFLPIANPQQEVVLHKEFLTGKDITCRIYLSEQGINGQLS